MSNIIHWDKLRVFYIVANYRSFNQAAQKLNSNQSSISRTIILLERQLKSQLFYRTSQGLELTKAGKDYYAVAKNIRIELEGVRMMHQLQQPKGVFKIASSKGALESWLSLILTRLIEKYPEIDFELIGHYESLDLFSGEADVSIMPTEKREQGLCYDHLFDRSWGLFASKKYIEKYGEPKTTEELNNHKILIMSTPFQYFQDRQDEELHAWPLVVGLPKGKRRKPVATLSSDYAITKAGLEGVGIFTGMREWPDLKNYPELKLILPEVSKKFSYYYIYPEQVKDSPFIKELYNFLKENQ